MGEMGVLGPTIKGKDTGRKPQSGVFVTVPKQPCSLVVLNNKLVYSQSKSNEMETRWRRWLEDVTA